MSENKAFQPDHMSIWELAHRWHGHNPGIGEPKEIPVEVQDTLRLIAEAQYHHQCGICKPNGVELKNRRVLGRREDFHFRPEDENLPEPDKNDIYANYLSNQSKFHDDLATDLPRCFENREFTRSYLESIHITKEWTFILCGENSLPLPEFWITEDEIDGLKTCWTIQILGIDGNFDISESGESSDKVPRTRIRQGSVDIFWGQLNHSQKTRLMCREVAKELWEKQPNLTITEICKNELIRAVGARHYGGRDTVRNWIRDLDPRPENIKSGRPSQ